MEFGNMEISIFLAKFLGWFFVIVSLIFFLRRKVLMEEMFRIAEDRGFTLVSGYLALIIGLITVVSHNVWTADWRVAITIFGWLALIKGIARMGFPEVARKSVLFFKEKTMLIQALLVVMFALGVWLVCVSY